MAVTVDPSIVEKTVWPGTVRLDVVKRPVTCAPPPTKEDAPRLLMPTLPILMVLPTRVEVTVSDCVVCVPVDKEERDVKRTVAVDAVIPRTIRLLPAKVDAWWRLAKVEPTFKLEFSVRLLVRMVSPIRVE